MQGEGFRTRSQQAWVSVLALISLCDLELVIGTLELGFPLPENENSHLCCVHSTGMLGGPNAIVSSSPNSGAQTPAPWTRSVHKLISFGSNNVDLVIKHLASLSELPTNWETSLIHLNLRLLLKMGRFNLSNSLSQMLNAWPELSSRSPFTRAGAWSFPQTHHSSRYSLLPVTPCYSQYWAQVSVAICYGSGAINLLLEKP